MNASYLLVQKAFSCYPKITKVLAANTTVFKLSNTKERMLKELINRENGFNLNYKRRLCHIISGNIGLGKKVFKRGLNSSINCLDLELVDGRYLLVGHGNGGISIYDTFISPQKNTYPIISCISRDVSGTHKHSVDSIQWYPHDTGMFVSLGSNRSIKIWDTNQLQIADKFEFSTDIFTCHLSSKVKSHALIATGSVDTKIYLCDMKSGSKTHTLSGHNGGVLTVKWSPRREHLLISGSMDHNIFLWDVRKARPHLATLQHNDTSSHNGYVNGLQFTRDGLGMLSLGTDNQLKLWDMVKQRRQGVEYGHIDNVSKRTIELSISDGFPEECVFVPAGSNIEVFEISSGRFTKSLSGHFMDVNCTCFNPFFMELYSGSMDTKILNWSRENEVDEDVIRLYDDSWSS